MKAFWGIYTVRIDTPWAANIKEKRAVIRSILDRIRRRHRISAARLHGIDRPTWEVIGVSTLSNEEAIVRQILRAVATEIAEGEGDYRVGRDLLDIEAIEVDAIVP